MPEYICYLLNAAGSTIAAEFATHATDQGAIEWAEAFLRNTTDGAGVDVWREAKRIYRASREAGRTCLCRPLKPG